MTAAEIARALGGQRSGDGWMVRCPAHDDHTPSLSIADGDRRMLVNCFAGCDQADVIEALRERGLWPDRTVGRSSRPAPSAKSRASAHPDGPPDHIWDYTDAEGVVVRRTLRWDRPKGDKVIRPQTPGSRGGWQYRDMRTPRPLYRLPELIERSAAPVLIVEGEHTANAAADMLPGYVATTSAGGSAAAKRTDWSVLQGRRVVVWPDADDAGGHYAVAVVRLAWDAGAVEVSPLCQ